MPELIELYKFELVLEDFHNLFLGKIKKLKGEVGNFRKNLNLFIPIIPTGLNCKIPSLSRSSYRRSICSNSIF